MENSIPLVSVIIPTYNAEGFITRCIDKVLAQTYKNIEIIVIDDCSTDQTMSLLESYGDQLKVLQNKNNSGPAYSRTKGLFDSNGEYVTFLDADDYWEEAFILDTVTFLQNNSEAVAVSTSYKVKDLKGQMIEKSFLDGEDIKFYGDEGNICPNFFDFWSKYFAVLTGTVMMRTSIAKQTKGQRRDLRLTEDLEFWAYLSTFGEWGFIPKQHFVGDPGVAYPWERLQKMKKRYDYFKDLSLDNWKQRIYSNISESQRKSFRNIENHIITTIAIAKVFSLQNEESRVYVEQNSSRLEKGLGSVLKNGLKLGSILWPLVGMALITREFFKSYYSYLVRTIR